MKRYFRTALVLMLICAVAATVLALVNSVTAPKIKAFEDQKVIDALKEISNGMDIGEKKVTDDEILYYYPLTKNSEITGYILGLSGSGYGGEFSLVASYNTSGEILGAKLLSNSETPGLGKKAENSEYMDKFIGTGDINSVPTNKNMLSETDAQAVSGASITFGGVSKALKLGSEYVKKMGGR